MGHLQQLEAELRERIAEGDVESLVKWIKDQVLQSYRNGLGARQVPGKGAERIPRGTRSRQYDRR